MPAPPHHLPEGPLSARASTANPASTGTKRTAFRATNVWSVPATALVSYLLDRGFSLALEGRLVPVGVTLEAFLLGAHTVMPLVLGALGLLVARTGQRLGRPGLVASVSYSLIASLAFGGLGISLASGAWVSRQTFAPALPLGGMGAGLLAGAVVGAAAVRFRTHAVYRGAVGAGAITAAVADRLVLPGLYPDFHLTAFVVQIALTLLLLQSLLAEVESRSIAARFSGLALGAAQGGLVVAWCFVPSTKVDALAASPYVANLAPRLLPRARSTRLGLELTRAIETSPAPRPAAMTPPGWQSDYDVVLIVADALRADTLPPNRIGTAAFAKNGDTPFLDHWLAGGYRFRYAYTQSTNTAKSVPPLFYGTQPFEHPQKSGPSLTRAMAQSGRTSIALVPRGFVGPENPETRTLLDDFVHVETYDENRQQDSPEKLRSLLRRVRGKRFFAYLHLYNTHGPYRAGRVTTPADGGAPQRYRLALRWLDGQMRELIALFADLDRSSNAVFIFTSDHGERIEARQSGHGGTVEEAEVRAPLTIMVPGKPGAIIERVAGNIDIYPTALDLIGAAPPPEARGRSLIPQMDDPTHGSEYPYYIVNGLGTQHAIVLGRQRLTYHSIGGFLTRHDLDLGERQNLFQPDSSVDSELASVLVRMNPEPASVVLHQPRTRLRLVQLIADIDGDVASPQLELLLRTAALTQDDEVMLALDALFDRATAEVRLEMVWHLGQSYGERWKQRLIATLPELSASDRALCVSTLARRNIAVDGYGP